MKKTVPLKKNYEFLRVYKNGQFFVGRFIILYVLKNKMEINRLGITTSKKVGKSVKRNRLRRLIRENYRAYEEFINEGYDIVFVARSTETMPTFGDINKEMKYLLKKLNIFNQERWSCLQNS
jgi:ribonuclease P protein component